MLASEIIEQALRESNTIPLGRAPTDTQKAESLPRLNNYIDGLFGTKLGEFIMDWPVPPRQTSPVNARWPLSPADTKLPRNVWPYLPNNVRIVNSVDSPTTIYLPRKPNDGSRVGFADVGATANLTINANGRFIEGGPSVILAAASDATEWFYRADLGSWQKRAPLTLDDPSPLPVEFDDLLITGLALRLGPRYGQEPTRATAQTNMAMERRLKQRYHQIMPKWGQWNPRMLSEQAHGENSYYEGEGNLLR